MGRNLLLMTYCFPPTNIIGSVRPYQLAKYFQQLGWNVYVISCADSSIPDSYNVDMSGMNLIRIKAPWLVSWTNGIPERKDCLSGKVCSLLIRGVKFLIRTAIFPDYFQLLKKPFINEAIKLTKIFQFDLLISSALPFTTHCAAQQVATSQSIPWVANNRDLWAVSPYRKGLSFRRWIDQRYEKHILGDARLILGVTEHMVDHYRIKLGFQNSLLIMNGYTSHIENDSAGQVDESRTQGRIAGLNIVYGGILYGTLRDPSPLFEAISKDDYLKDNVRVRFFGSEQKQISAHATAFGGCAIEWHERVSKKDIADIYREASLLLVILGSGVFEKGVMTGKFFEYLSFGKPILAIASESSELAQVINKYDLGLASTNPAVIRMYLNSLLNGSSPRVISLPMELSIDHQLSHLYAAVEKIV